MRYRIETYFSLTLLSLFWQRLSPLLLALQGLKISISELLGSQVSYHVSVSL